MEMEDNRMELVQAFSTHLDDKHKGILYKELGSVPSGLAIGQLGEYYITDSDTCVVKVFDQAGCFLHTFGQGLLQCPVDLTITSSGKVVVTDKDAGDVKVFSRVGKLLVTSEFGMHLLEPHGIDYDPRMKKIAICDKGASCVYVHDHRGIVQCVLTVGHEELSEKTNDKEWQYVGNTPAPEDQASYPKPYVHTALSPNFHFGKHSKLLLDSNKSLDKFSADSKEQGSHDHMSDNTVDPVNKCSFSPTSVRFDPYSTDIFVTDQACNTLYAFDAKGTLKTRYHTGQLHNPTAICFGESGYVYIADTEGCNIMCTDRTGKRFQPLVTWEDGLSEPRALEMNKMGNLVVTEGNTGLVKIYKIWN